MTRERTPDEIRRLKAKGIFDVGSFYVRTRGFSRVPKQKFWDEDEVEK